MSGSNRYIIYWHFILKDDGKLVSEKLTSAGNYYRTGKARLYNFWAFSYNFSIIGVANSLTKIFLQIEF